MRRAVLLAVVTAVAVALPASAAFAVSGTQKFSASFSPSKSGTKKKPRGGTLKVRPFFDVGAERAQLLGAPFYTDVAEVYFPKESTFEGRRFPTCARATVLANEKRCPKGSQIGSGTAAGFALGLVENLKVTIFNGKRSGSAVGQIELLVVGNAPLVIRDVISGPITRVSGSVSGLNGSYGLKLSVDVPPGLQEPAPGALATLTDFNTTVKGTVTKTTRKRGKRVKTKYSVVNSIGCSKGKWDFGYIGRYNDGTSQAVETSGSCRK